MPGAAGHRPRRVGPRDRDARDRVARDRRRDHVRVRRQLGQRVARPSRAHGARERERRAHRPADQLARAGPVLRAPHVATRSAAARATTPSSTSRRRARRPHGRARREAPRSSPSVPQPGVPRLRDLMLAQADAVFPSHLVPVYEPDPSTSLAAQSEALGRDPEELLYEWTIADDGDGARALLPRWLRREPRRARRAARAPGDRARPRRRRRPRRPHLRRRLPVVPPLLLGARAPTRHHPAGAGGRRSSPANPPRSTACATAVRSNPGSRPTSTSSTRSRSRRARWRSCTTSPPGAKRVLQRTDGFVATIVDGQVVQRDGVDTGARPGRRRCGASVT